MKFKYSYYNIVVSESEEFVYLYNSYSGALCKLEKDIHTLILNSALDDENKCKFFDELHKQGFIVSAELNEYNKILLNERIETFSRSTESISYVIAPTLSCNLNCFYCFENGYRNRTIMSDKTLYDVADYILSRTNGVKNIHVGWFGGEPLIAYDKIIKFSEYLIPQLMKKQINYTAGMISNGVLLTNDKAKTLFESCGLKNIQITIDGTQKVYCTRKKATEKQFNDLLDNICTAVKYMRVAIRLNCDGNNYEDLKVVSKQLIEKCGKNNNLSIYLAKLVNYTDCTGEFFSQFEFDEKRIEFDKYICELQEKISKPKRIKYRKIFCGLYKLNNQVIGPEGELYKCEHHIGQRDKAIGSIQYGLNYSDWLMKFLESKPMIQCKTCKLFPICLGGCPAQRENLHNGESCCFSMEYIQALLKQHIEQYGK